MKKLFLFTALAGLLTACAPKAYESLKKGETKVNFAWESLGCNGTCAIYKAAINRNSLQFTGIRNTKFVGDTIIADWGAQEQELIQRLAQMDVLSLDSLYKMSDGSYDGPGFSYLFQIRDAQNPSQLIENKKIETFGNAPESLNSLQKWLGQQLAEAGLL